MKCCRCGQELVLRPGSIVKCPVCQNVMRYASVDDGQGGRVEGVWAEYVSPLELPQPAAGMGAMRRLGFGTGVKGK